MSHHGVPKLLDQISGFEGQVRRQMKRLYRLKIEADYLPESIIDKETAKQAIRPGHRYVERTRNQP